MSDANGNLTTGDIFTDRATGKKSVVINCPNGNKACEQLHLREIAKPTLNELRDLSNKVKLGDLTEEDEIRISLADEADMVTVIGESLTLRVSAVSITEKKE